MSNITTQETERDFTPEQEAIIAEFKEKGLPMIAEVSDNMVAKSYNLYLSGKGYAEISSSVKIKMEHLLFLSDKYNWFNRRGLYLEEVQNTLIKRVAETKMRGTNFLIDYAHAFMANKSGELAEAIQNPARGVGSIDKKDLDAFIKVIETIDKLTSASLKEAPVTINLPDGGEVKEEKGTITVTPPPVISIKDVLKKAKDKK